MRVIKCVSCGIKVGEVHEYNYGNGRTNYCDDFNSFYGGEIDGESYCNDCYNEKLEELIGYMRSMREDNDCPPDWNVTVP